MSSIGYCRSCGQMQPYLVSQYFNHDSLLLCAACNVRDHGEWEKDSKPTGGGWRQPDFNDWQKTKYGWTKK